MREPQYYRQTLEWLTAVAEGRGWLSTTDIAQILGVDRHTVARRYGISKGCALPVLAWKLSEEGVNT